MSIAEGAGNGSQRNAWWASGLRLWLAVLVLPMVLGGCGSFSGARKSSQADSPGCCPRPGRGGFYLDDGPGDNPPANLDAIPDAVPRIEPINRATSRPYAVMGKTYTPMTELSPYRERGVATWYGRRYHGKQTSSGEPYDMYRMTAAHTVLPIPSYARVTNVDNGRSVVVRINDRGPFIGERLIDLSYVAAHKLDIVRSGSATVEVEALLTPGDPPAAHGRPAASVAAIEPPTAYSPSPPVAAGTPAHYVQLGAFSLKENADRFVERVRALPDLETATVSIVPTGSLYRIQAGPYADRIAAEQAAQRFEALLGSSAVITTPR